MRHLLSLLILIVPVAAHAGDHTIMRNASVKISLNVAYMQETMIVLPEKAVSVTGASAPSFQVEAGGDFIMVRPLKPDAVGNLFINFGAGTIVSLNLSTVEGGGDNLVTLRFDAKPAPAQGAVSGNVSLKGDIGALAGPWDVIKLGAKADNAGFTVQATHAITVDDNIFINFRVENDTKSTFNVSDINLVRNTYSGLKGTTVVDTAPVPSKYTIDTKALSPGSTAYGTLVFPKTYVDFDQMLVLKIQDEHAQGPELRISL